MQNRKLFGTAFLILGFVMKVVAELIHEVIGHGVPIVLFGGEITHLYISVLWPYDLSHIGWSFSGMIAPAQLAWIYAGGILACSSISFFVQAVQVARGKMRWCYNLALFWLAFWTLANSAGYLLVSGLSPFGDVLELVRLGVLTSLLSFIIGFIMFAVGFVVLSKILRNILAGAFSSQNADLYLVLFWLIIPAISLAMFANPERRLQTVYIALSLIPFLVLLAAYCVRLSKNKAKADPDNITKEQG